MSTLTKGDINRSQLEQANEEKAQKAELQRKQQIFNNKAKNKIMGEYKRAVIDSYVDEFFNNYGDNVDYNSLIDSFTFSVKGEGINSSPDFTFNPNRVEFRSDARKECQKFNENSYSDFISNDDELSGNEASVYYFNNAEEYEAFQEGNIDINELDMLDGEFISTNTDDEERYNYFNKVNKILGYETVEGSVKEANLKATNSWAKSKNKVIVQLIKENIRL